VEKSLTLIASLRCVDGLILGADTQEVISEPPLLKTTREKLRVLRNPVVSDWSIVLGGAGEYDYIGMIGDFIEEKVSQSASSPTQGDIDNGIRAAVAQVWRDYARYEQRTIDIKMLIASRSNEQSVHKLTVVSGAAVRRGSDVEAIGIGDATFKTLVDRFIPHGMLSTASVDVSTARVFMVYAMLQAKLSIPGIGGSTRIITMTQNGLKWMKSWSVHAIQEFFGGMDAHIRGSVQQLAYSNPQSGDPVESMLATVSKGLMEDYRELKIELDRIDNDETLV
jgi:hypothetical protein